MSCCCGVCVGCCLPVDYTVPQYPDGVVSDIPFEFVAPNCPALNGVGNVFTPVNPTSATRGSCGPCISYLGQNATVLSGSRRMEMGAVCFQTPCSINVCLILDCGADEIPVPGLDACCSRLRLWVGTSDKQAEDIGDKPAAAGSLSCTSWKKVEPSHCSCAGNTVSARFPFSITFDCPPFTTGPCAGQSTCCGVTCDLTDAEVVI